MHQLSFLGRKRLKLWRNDYVWLLWWFQYFEWINDVCALYYQATAEICLNRSILLSNKKLKINIWLSNILYFFNKSEVWPVLLLFRGGFLDVPWSGTLKSEYLNISLTVLDNFIFLGGCSSVVDYFIYIFVNSQHRKYIHWIDK